MKKKVHELAKEMGLRNKDLIARAGALEIEVKSHMSSLTEEEIGKIRDGGTPETGKAKTGKGGSSQTNLKKRIHLYYNARKLSLYRKK